ncbi:MAG: Flp family type IVb pilin [Propionibacteriales bacterium]|nr:Flp family type IVb pilin [Propionibacteriales bacterium]
MLNFFRTITSRRDEDGASAVEYGLLVAGIAALIVAIVFVFGGVIKDTFSKTCGKVSSGTAGTYDSTASCG